MFTFIVAFGIPARTVFSSTPKFEHAQSSFGHVEGSLSPQRRSLEIVGGDQNLFIATQPEQGLHVAQVAEIRAFAERVPAVTFS